MDAQKTLLILGGSLGAEGLNRAVVAVLQRRWPEFSGWQIVHQTGAAHFEEIARTYTAAGMEAIVQPFFDDLPQRYRAATVAVTRAGAGTLAELACAGIPAILLPYPQAADHHQLANAQVYEKAGAVIVVEHAADPAVTAERLASVLRPLITDPQRQRTMRAAMRGLARPNAAQQVADCLLSHIPHSAQ